MKLSALLCKPRMERTPTYQVTAEGRAQSGPEQFAAVPGSVPFVQATPSARNGNGAGGAGVGGVPAFDAEGVTLHHCDCLELMRATPDNAFDLAIVDPPYGISAEKMNMGDGCYGKGRKNRLSQGAGKLKTRILQNGQSEWDASPPDAEYFAELRRVSRHQIIWGGNYFSLPPTRCVVAWDKEQPWPNFSAWEMAWTSFDTPAKHFRWNNQGTGNPGKIHPTQKPIQLYAWLLTTFAKPGQRILDTHLGSGSIAIACRNFGASLVACEISGEYPTAAIERIRADFAQGMLFSGGGGAERQGEATWATGKEQNDQAERQEERRQ